ncbi:wiskott-Aldrich syndrome protein-like [Pipistrellus kuhlii]|uniref:wiskott-Aldrich syndrome protein-like n=1 Tax=Pipistrellus kuhlii TaxID=59472 RepID=UPI001E26F97D|nr:wiskott-Aldrich syndrome protein-like [Pipistrellus kuhlii]
MREVAVASTAAPLALPSPAVATRPRQLSHGARPRVLQAPPPARGGLPLARRPPRRRDVIGQVEVRLLARSSHWTRRPRQVPSPRSSLASSPRPTRLDPLPPPVPTGPGRRGSLLLPPPGSSAPIPRPAFPSSLPFPGATSAPAPWLHGTLAGRTATSGRVRTPALILQAIYGELDWPLQTFGF